MKSKSLNMLLKLARPWIERFADVEFARFFLITMLCIDMTVLVVWDYIHFPKLAPVTKPDTLLRLKLAMVGGAVFVYGETAYAFKRRHQMFYGCMEIIFGITAAIIAATYRKVDDPTTLAAILGCVYVVVRGRTNVSEAERISKELK
jgi:hypothetical protein